MREQNGGYFSNLNIILTPYLKNWLGMTDIVGREVYLAYFVPYPFSFCGLCGGFAVTDIGIFSNYLNSDTPYGNYVSFEDLAQAQTICEAWLPPIPQLSYSQLFEPYRTAHRWLVADNRQLAFFTYTDFYGSTHIINLFREIASSVRRDLGIGRLNILPNSEDEDE